MVWRLTRYIANPSDYDWEPEEFKPHVFTEQFCQTDFINDYDATNTALEFGNIGDVSILDGWNVAFNTRLQLCSNEVNRDDDDEITDSDAVLEAKIEAHRRLRNVQH